MDPEITRCEVCTAEVHVDETVRRRLSPQGADQTVCDDCDDAGVGDPPEGC